jgi:polysaccharide biosynthesis transport protein
MVDRENREDWRRERSLLALGQAMRGEDDASLVSIGDRADPSWREDAATRHRLARSRREARTNPTPSAAAVEVEPFRPDEQPEAAAQDDAWRSREDAGSGDLPPAVQGARMAP